MFLGENKAYSIFVFSAFLAWMEYRENIFVLC